MRERERGDGESVNKTGREGGREGERQREGAVFTDLVI